MRPHWPAATRALRTGTQDTINQSGQQIVRRQLNVTPTLTIPQVTSDFLLNIIAYNLIRIPKLITA